jgi:hypothetical protein
VQKVTSATVQYRERSDRMLHTIQKSKRKLRVAPPCFARGTVLIAPSFQDPDFLCKAESTGRGRCTPQQLTSFKDDAVVTYGYSNDGKMIAITRATVRNDVVSIREFR